MYNTSDNRNTKGGLVHISVILEKVMKDLEDKVAKNNSEEKKDVKDC